MSTTTGCGGPCVNRGPAGQAKLEAERQAQVDLVIALQAEIRFAQSKYKAVREELAAAVVGGDHERKRVAEIQSYWHHNQKLPQD